MKDFLTRVKGNKKVAIGLGIGLVIGALTSWWFSILLAAGVGALWWYANETIVDEKK